MNCPKCNAQNPDGSLFCSTCGSTMEGPVSENPLFKEKGSRNTAPTLPPYGMPPQQSMPPEPTQQNQNFYVAPPSQMPPQQQGPYNNNMYGSYNNYMPGPGMPPVKGDRSKNWAAITGLILGILSIFCCFFPVWTYMLDVPMWLSLLLILPALIFNIIGLKSAKKGLAIAGLICTILGLLFAVYMMTFIANNQDQVQAIIDDALREAGYNF